MSEYQIAAYYFPNYHVDPRNERDHGPGWTEWELVRRAEPRFPGHAQPKVPAWGYEDESDPRAMARKIDAAADHAIDAFLFDWYWYDDGPFLERGLEKGFLQAPNVERLRFAIHWANHTWINIHPAKMSRSPFSESPVLYPGPVTRATFDTVTEYCIERYFRHPSYWRIDGKPLFAIYELACLLDGLGGLEATRDALASFRRKVEAAGFPGLELNAIVWSIPILPGETAVREPAELLRALGFDSVGSYVWVHHVPLNDFPETSYPAVAEAAYAHWERSAEAYGMPFYPNVTMGWDSSPRTVQSDRFLNVGYPFTPTLAGNTPAAFEAALRRARAFLDTRPAGRRILSLNAWNEWTEGSYLEPDTVHGMGYLEAIRRVFGDAARPAGAL